MSWKKISYWLKGGLAGLLIGILLLLTLLNSNTTYCNNLISEFECTSIVFNWIYCTFVILICFAIGSLIGFIFGKIKSGRKLK